MKLLDIDWAEFLARMPAWDRLPAQARRFLVRLDTNPFASVAHQRDHEQMLLTEGLIKAPARDGFVELTGAGRALARTMETILQHDILKDHRPGVFQTYITDHFSMKDLERFLSSPAHPYTAAAELLPRVFSETWLEQYVAAETAAPETRGKRAAPPVQTRSGPRRPVHRASAAARALTRAVMGHPTPVPIRDLPGMLADIPLPTLGAAMRDCIASLVLFPAVRREDATPMIGLWPSLHRRLHRPRLSAPAPVAPIRTFEGAFLLDDLTALLSVAAAAPLRIRVSDQGLFAKHQRELEAITQPLPDWIAPHLRYSIEARMHAAKQWAMNAGLMHQVTDAGGYPTLVPTRAGKAWLAQSPKGRLKALIDQLRGSQIDPDPAVARRPDGGPADGRDAGHADPAEEMWETFGEESELLDDGDARAAGNGVELLPFALQLPAMGDAQDILRRAVLAACASLEREAVVPADSFVEWKQQESNPFLARGAEPTLLRVHGGWSSREATPDEAEETWGQCLMQFLCQRLYPLGCVRVAQAEGSKSMCFGLTGPGRYLLGLTGDFEFGTGVDTEGKLVVQPNFEVVFLAPAPAAEALLTRFAQRKRSGLGALFAITKKSIQNAAASGMTAAQVLDTLRELSSKPLPENVAREITGWCAQVRRIEVRPALLLRCPDAETAARVLALAGHGAALVSETVIELPAFAREAELLRKLRGTGIFADRAEVRLAWLPYGRGRR